MDLQPLKLRVIVYTPEKEAREGWLTYSIEGPRITLEDGIVYLSSNFPNDMNFTIPATSLREFQIPLTEYEKVEFVSRSIVKTYSSSPTLQNEMYPKSTEQWVTYLSEYGINALFVTHPLAESSRYLLIIIEIESGHLLSAIKINSYELGLLFMKRDWDIYAEIFSEINPSIRKSIISELLDSSPPDWSEMASLVKGVNVPNLAIGKSMRESMDQLVPKSFPANVREELMAFLALITKQEIPNEDPLVISSKYRTTPLLSTLIFHHIHCLIMGEQPPQYVRLFIMADRGTLRTGMQPTVEASERNPWSVAWIQLTNMVPNRRGRIFNLLSNLDPEREIITRLPVFQKEAAESRTKWADRFALILYNSSIRGHVQNQKIGLRTLIYVGSAHRWPHRHLAWTARLGNPNEKPPYIQVMVMPQSAAERVRRVRRNISEELWSTMTANFGLYNNETQKWKANTTRILQSISSKRTLKQLGREFNVKTDDNIRIPSLEEAKLLGFFSRGMYLSSLEEGNYDKYLGLNQERLTDVISNLMSSGIIHPQYFIHMLGLVSLCTIAKGPALNIQSLSRSFLKHTPSTTVRLMNGGNESIILSRMPEDAAYEISTKLPSLSNDELEVKIMVNAYAAYTLNLYERLLLPDGTWDDDITGFLSQIRR